MEQVAARPSQWGRNFIVIAVWVIFGAGWAYFSWLLLGDWLTETYERWRVEGVPGWHWLALHKELLVNIADLLSFFFVTPEIASRLASSELVKRALTGIPFISSLILWAIFATRIWFSALMEGSLPIWKLLVGSFFVFGFDIFVVFVFLSIFLGRWAAADMLAGDTLRRAMLYVGAVLFVLSRSLAITAAIVAG